MTRSAHRIPTCHLSLGGNLMETGRMITEGVRTRRPDGSLSDAVRLMWRCERGC